MSVPEGLEACRQETRRESKFGPLADSSHALFYPGRDAGVGYHGAANIFQASAAWIEGANVPIDQVSDDG